MATYNGAKFIREQLDDLAVQTHAPAELVVCDDCSTDATLDILEQFATTAPFAVHVHRNPQRLGYRANFVRCAGLCRSELIAFCDQDDRWDLKKLEHLLGSFRDAETLLVYHNAKIASGERRDLGFLYPGQTTDRINAPMEMDPWFVALGFTQVFRRSLLLLDDLWRQSVDQNNVQEPLAHDQWYFFLASVLGKIAYVHEPLATYRQHGRNTSQWFRHKFYSRLIDGLRAATMAGARRRMLSAEARANVLQSAIPRLPPHARDLLVAGADYYRRATDVWHLRSELYQARDFRTRLSILHDLLASNAYALDDRSLAVLPLGIDLTVGLTGLLRFRASNRM
jgi:glycosyltransferase involved in cell wall biosynthesis